MNARSLGRFGVSRFPPLAESDEQAVLDGDTVAMEGFTHLIPFAAGHEVIRQRRRHLTLIRMTPDLIYDQLIGMGCADKLVFSWVGNPGVGSLHRFRDAYENGWPAPIAIEEHSHAAMANAYVAGAAGLPFAVFRGYIGVDLPRRTCSNRDRRLSPSTARGCVRRRSEDAMTYSAGEVMTIAAARALRNSDICFVGIGMPSAACNLARFTHAPDITLIYESGTIATKPDVLPLSIGDGELCATALTTVAVPEMF